MNVINVAEEMMAATKTRGGRNLTDYTRSRILRPLKVDADPGTNFTLRVGVRELSAWRKEAEGMGLSIGSMVRAAMTDYLEEVNSAHTRAQIDRLG